MPYITVRNIPAPHQITLDDIIFGVSELPKQRNTDYTSTRTRYVSHIPETPYSAGEVDDMILRLRAFCERYAALYEVPRRSLYTHFDIPKKSGGLRPIDAPNEELMSALYDLKRIFEQNLYALYHTNAFAYIKGRSALKALQRHQHNESKWFGKFDFKNFFPSTTPEFLFSMLSQMFPFCWIVARPEGAEVLKKALDLAFLDGGLPQGTPMSPMLTNLMMIPIDHTISAKLRNWEDQRFVYTRYADDILISSRYTFNIKRMENCVNEALASFKAPFKINAEKTRYGSSAGRNWNLGLMLNKDNEITLGRKRNEQFRAMVNNYAADHVHGKLWPLEDIQRLDGHISYHRMVEKEHTDTVLARIGTKYGLDVCACIAEDKRGFVAV